MPQINRWVGAPRVPGACVLPILLVYWWDFLGQDRILLPNNAPFSSTFVLAYALSSHHVSALCCACMQMGDLGVELGTADRVRHIIRLLGEGSFDLLGLRFIFRKHLVPADCHTPSPACCIAIHHFEFVVVRDICLVG